MRKYLQSIFLCFLIFAMQSCRQEGTYQITGEVMLPEGSVVTLWPDDNSHQIAGAGIANHQFKMEVEGLDEGVYNLLVSWKNPNREAQVLKSGSKLNTPDTLYATTTIYLSPNADYHVGSSIKDITQVSVPTKDNPNPFPLITQTNSQASKDLQLYLNELANITNVFQEKQDSLSMLINAAQTKNDLESYGKNMKEYEGLGDGFLKETRFLARKKFVNTHLASPISAYIIAMAADLKENKNFYQQAVDRLDASLKLNRYTIEAKRRLATLH